MKRANNLQGVYSRAPYALLPTLGHCHERINTSSCPHFGAGSRRPSMSVEIHPPGPGTPVSGAWGTWGVTYWTLDFSSQGAGGFSHARRNAAISACKARTSASSASMARCWPQPGRQHRCHSDLRASPALQASRALPARTIPELRRRGGGRAPRDPRVPVRPTTRSPESLGPRRPYTRFPGYLISAYTFSGERVLCYS